MLYSCYYGRVICCIGTIWRQNRTLTKSFHSRKTSTHFLILLFPSIEFLGNQHELKRNRIRFKTNGDTSLHLRWRRQGNDEWHGFPFLYYKNFEPEESSLEINRLTWQRFGVKLNSNIIMWVRLFFCSKVPTSNLPFHSDNELKDLLLWLKEGSTTPSRYPSPDVTEIFHGGRWHGDRHIHQSMTDTYMCEFDFRLLLFGPNFIFHTRKEGECA